MSEKRVVLAVAIEDEKSHVAMNGTGKEILLAVGHAMEAMLENGLEADGIRALAEAAIEAHEAKNAA